MKQEGPYPTGFPVAKGRFSQPSSNMEPPNQILNMEKTFKSNVVDTSRLNHTEKLNQVRYRRLGVLSIPKMCLNSVVITKVGWKSWFLNI